ncbi:MAG: hypothetical protein KGO02_26035 [Alphaproteobacteria bacterium]|nr:hypothetical protein [Alphaproteobacteria bacterium]
MPVVAVVGAVAGMAMGGAAAIGSVIAGTATLATTLEAVAAVGATVSAVGAVTGDKGLMNAGLIMGGIGGVGALAANAGLFGAAATSEPLFGSASSAASSSAANAINTVTIDPNMDAFAGGSAIQPLATVSPTQDVLNSLTQPSMSDLQSGIVSPEGALNTGSTLATTPLNDQMAATAGNANALTQNPASTLATGNPVSTPNPAGGNVIPPSPVEVPKGAGTVTGLPGAVAPTAPSSGLSTSEQDLLAGAGATNAQPVTQASLDAAVKATQPGSFGHLLAFAGKHQVVTYGVLQAGGALVSGLFSPVTPAQVNALNAQAAANRAGAALTQQEVANMKSGIPVATRSASTVTGKPQGLINTPPPSTAANVTGIATNAQPAAGVGM